MLVLYNIYYYILSLTNKQWNIFIEHIKNRNIPSIQATALHHSSLYMFFVNVQMAGKFAKFMNKVGLQPLYIFER